MTALDARRELLEPAPVGTFPVVDVWSEWRGPCPAAGCGRPVHRYSADAAVECWEHRPGGPRFVGYCAPARCYCGRPGCPAVASWRAR